MTETEKKPTTLIQGRPLVEDTDQLFKIADALSRSALCPKQYKGNSKDAFAAILAGAEVGFQPMQSLKNIAIVNGKPCIHSDGLPAIVLKSAQVKSKVSEYRGTPYEDDFRHYIRIERHGIEGAEEFEFSVADARLAGLWGKAGTWTNYPKRMLKYRNQSFAYRDMFADFICGLHVIEEQQDIADHHAPIHVEAEEPPTFAELADDTEPSDEVPYPDAIDAQTEPVEPEQPWLAYWQDALHHAPTEQRVEEIAVEAQGELDEDRLAILEPYIEQKRRQLEGELF